MGPRVPGLSTSQGHKKYDTAHWGLRSSQQTIQPHQHRFGHAAALKWFRLPSDHRRPLHALASGSPFGGHDHPVCHRRIRLRVDPKLWRPLNGHLRPRIPVHLGTFLTARQNIGDKDDKTTAYHPEVNYLVERFHRRLKEALLALGADEPEKWFCTSLVGCYPSGRR